MSFFVLISRTPDVPKKLTDFAREHDPFFNLVGMHTTLIFPTPAEVGKEELINHIEKVLATWKPLHVRFNKLEKSWDHWLFITPSQGRKEITELHDQLYKGVMKPYLREDIPFTPHLALGLFANKEGLNPREADKAELDAKAYDKALKWAQNQKIDLKYEFKDCDLIELDDKFTEAKEINRFLL